MLFNNERCRNLTPEYVSTARMFDFSWAKNTDSLIAEWNHLVGYDEPNPDAKIVHFTKGIPVWDETRDCEFSKEWWDTCWRMNATVTYDALMGPSVHNEKRLVTR